MYTQLLCILSLCITTSLAFAPSHSVRSFCPNVTFKRNFSLSDLAGTWYEVSRVPNIWEVGICSRIQHNLTADGTAIHLFWEQLIGQWPSSFQYSSASSQARRIPGGHPGQLLLEFDQEGAYPQPYYIIDIDPRSYYIAYTCYPLRVDWLTTGVLYVEMAWIMSREIEMDPVSRNLRKQTLEESGVITSWLAQVEQDNCNSLYEQYTNTPTNGMPTSARKTT